MKAALFKIIKSLLNKSSFYKLKKYSYKKIILIGLSVILFLVILFYLLRPFYFDYALKKDVLEKKIYQSFKLNSDIDGEISFGIFPTPRIIVENINLKLGKKKKIKINKIQILIEPLKINSIESFELKKFLVSEQDIKLYPSNLKEIFNYFTLHKKEKVIFKNSKIVFIDNQNNIINFSDFNLKEKFSNKKHEINAKLNFSGNKINFEFLNNLESKKFLEINIPNLKQSLEINFDEKSTLENLVGQLRLKVFESILLLNFEGKDSFKLSKSYLRNKFINSKIDGKINLKNQFSFDINLDVNLINLRKLLLYYPFFKTGGLSKKINGKLNISVKNADTLFGKIRDTKMILIFQNGDIRAKNISANLSENSNLKLNFSLLLSEKNPQMDFDMKFSSKEAKKFLRKFGIYNFEENNLSLYVDGNLDFNSNKVRFKKVIRDNSQLVGRNQVKILEESFNQNVLKEGVLGVLDFFKFKKFFKEIY